MGSNGRHGGVLGTISVPLLDSAEGTLLLSGGQLDDSDVEGLMGEVLGDGTSGSDDGDLSGLSGNLNWRG